MLFTLKQKEIIQSFFNEYGDFDINNETECKSFMFNLEQHLAGKDCEEVLNREENQLFLLLLSNNNLENFYPAELVTAFQKFLVHIKNKSPNHIA